ncbi:MBL fold metallo-hydrolase [Halostagnicola kamekurae]|uniref:Glyoxylase, beta-lactamase superfamily II n=1 Tax=Halostagnicola kamekurae TaxID=619731 RepID=A0A1I6TNM5_9EURY|nr:MBL fold metallo-hydrolase [Halostagnicola kamekurae]SFS90577.1 Glyoxylase, beta-lactamase superfamily II [Halostagnicola kamekurae]
MSERVRIDVGEGSPEGANSAYLLPDRGVLIDPGPPTERAWSNLLAGIADAAASITDLEHVLVTHWHVDHAGLAPRIAERANAELHVHRADSPLIGDYASERERRLERDERTLARWGVPEARRTTVLDGDTPSPLPDSFPVRARDDGDVIAGVEVVHTPGHTGGHASFRTADDLYLGDLLLPTYTPNVGGSDTRLSDPLAMYLSSLDRLEDAPDRGRPGHGTTIEIEAACKEVREHHRERARACFRALEPTESAASTPWAVARELFGEMSGVHAKFGAGEAAAHLERLAALDLVRPLEGEPVEYIRAVESYPDEIDLSA